jgi:hypothetical protein
VTDLLQYTILDQIPFTVDLPALMKRLRVKETGPHAAEFTHLLEQAQAVARPRALYLAAYITNRGEDWVEIEGTRFDSRVLVVNLQQAHRVFPYLVTCGPELQEWAAGLDDMLLSFWAEGIKEAALFCAITAFNAHVEDCYHPGHTASMSPGSLADWPIQQQRAFFDLLHGQENAIGVCLTESMLMVPNKSVSGIRFSTEAAFESCQLCPREGCPGRRAVYDSDLYDSRYCLHGN